MLQSGWKNLPIALALASCRPAPPAEPVHASPIAAEGVPAPARDPVRGVALDLPSDATQTRCDADACVWAGEARHVRFMSEFIDVQHIDGDAVLQSVGGTGEVHEQPPGSGRWLVTQNCGHFWTFLQVGGRVVRLHCSQTGLPSAGHDSCATAAPDVAQTCASLRVISSPAP